MTRVKQATCLVDSSAIMLPNGGKLVNAAQASVGQDQGTGLQHPFAAVL